MNNSPSISEILKRLRPGERQNPVRDWIALVSVATIMLVALVVWNIWAFDTVVGGGVIGVPAQVAAPLADQDILDMAHAGFVSRAEEEKKYLDGSYRFTDPSQ